eukprot:gnl/MRDRNA2_/MRDRNA2_93730_c0_seq1.p1 gnl/MRDRNA2_/MRDRNA2_93730_c0~~gnl/MRDRNA2_/MRDRNA2_93730_c0_seq1.p1  ORF type:complete len:724 (-),score=207.87 gnl/MRDRNA2_/MRDRNA2_93730_c0_seq1:24-2195(-)
MKMVSYLQVALLAASTGFIRSAAVREEPEFKAAIESGKTVLENIEVKMNFRKAEGLEHHDSAEGSCNSEKRNKLARKERVKVRMQEIDTLVYQAVDKQTTLEMHIKRLDEEISKTQQSLQDSSSQVESLDEESEKTDAAHEAMIGTLQEAIVTLEGADESADAADQSAEDAVLAKEAGVLLTKRLGAVGSSASPGMDVVVGALKGMKDKVIDQRAEDMKTYRTTRANTVALIKTCEKDLEDQTEQQDQLESQLVNASQKLSNYRREKFVLQTKIKGNNDVLDAYVDFCKEDLSDLAQRHRHRVDKVLQFVSFAKAAVVNARPPPVVLLKKNHFSYASHEVLLPEELRQKSKTPTYHIPQGDTSQRLSFVEKNVAHAALHGAKSTLKSLKRLERVGNKKIQDIYQAVAPAVKPTQRTPKSMILRCKKRGSPAKEPALLAASWALQDAASQLRSRALHRTACEVRYRTPQDARHLLTMLVSSLQKGMVVQNQTSSFKDADDCVAKELAHKAELRAAKEEAKKAQEQASKTELFISEYQVEKVHLETYAPKLQEDMDALVSHSTTFEELYSGDKKTAAEMRTLLSGVIDEMSAVKAIGPDEPLEQLDEAIEKYSIDSKADAKAVSAGIGGLQEKLNKRRHLMKTWDEWLDKAIPDQQAKLKEEIAERDKAMQAVDDLKASAPEPCEKEGEKEGVALVAHWRQTRNWTRAVEIAAVELALSLLSVGK